MVVDLQGVISTNSEGHKSIELTDPAIHCTELTRFGRTNLGKRGMRCFFRRHICNEICQKMGLAILSADTWCEFGTIEEEDEEES